MRLLHKLPHNGKSLKHPLEIGVHDVRVNRLELLLVLGLHVVDDRCDGRGCVRSKTQKEGKNERKKDDRQPAAQHGSVRVSHE